MKIMKKSLLALALLSVTANLLPRNGGAIAAGVATGALVGTGIALAASDRDRGYYDDSYPVVYNGDYDDDYYTTSYYPRRYRGYRRNVRSSNETPRTVRRTTIRRG